MWGCDGGLEADIGRPVEFSGRAGEPHGCVFRTLCGNGMGVGYPFFRAQVCAQRLCH
ncbi:hypothetical protein SBV1_2030001 [Verrucomicrobia bacterium]|nr:hypothetical protein SBV1_2030001 [Verrucomicrobiota bacterium]